MKMLMTLFLVLPSLSLWAQETEQKTVVKYDYPPMKETFYVLKSNTETKHGAYEKIYVGQTIKGQFDHNKKVGIWEYYDNKNELEQKIDFDSGKVIFTKPTTLIRTYFIKEGEQMKEVVPDEVPVFQGGQSALVYHSILNIKYPAEARSRKTQGNTVVSAIITKEGKND